GADDTGEALEKLVKGEDPFATENEEEVEVESVETTDETLEKRVKDEDSLETENGEEIEVEDEQ
ncbi:MAG: hypothetical protein GY866_17390, partial [Proteobacteria bacterium]|nr:hypothetical protein [Pseudomonadota bacterium]